ncbi:tetratricopeptide repeat protein [candidate division KSB1 bacterium]|nr:tetratricopeptide repeat protein [candidate division KSB1 bacterium]
MDANNVRKQVGTSLLTIFIIALGLFLVCGVNPPAPMIDDDVSSDFTEGDSTGDDELADILDEGSDTPAENSDESLLEEDSEFASSGDDDTNDILSLLDSEDSGSSEDDDLFSFDDDESGDNSEYAKASVSELTGSASGSEEGSQYEGSMTNESYKEMEKEADRLSEVLDKKASEADSLKEILAKHDDEIAARELNRSMNQKFTPTPSPISTPPPKLASNLSSSSPSRRSRSSESAASGSSRGGTFKSKFNSAIADFNSGKFNEATQSFESLLFTEPANTLASDCQYWLGECFMAMKDYSRAVVEYEKVFIFDEGKKSEEAQFKIGVSFLEAGNPKLAKYEFNNLLNFYADSELGRRARSYLQRL